MVDFPKLIVYLPKLIAPLGAVEQRSPPSPPVRAETHVPLVRCIAVCFEQTSSSTLTPVTRLLVFCVLRLDFAQEGVSQGRSLKAEGVSPHSVNYLDM